jgi:catechol 2,3-dioxygenase-like lactoylglutathione lyase family enzyme
VIKAVALLLVMLLQVSTVHAADAPATQPMGETGPGVPKFKVRPGYKVTLVAEHFGEARFIELGPDGEIYVSQPDRGRIVCLRDPDAEGLQKHHHICEMPQRGQGAWPAVVQGLAVVHRIRLGPQGPQHQKQWRG